MSRAATPAELFEHSAWVLALARGLVGESGAGDVAQQAMLAALRRPPVAGGSLRPWLRRVVQNFAAKWVRGESNRRQHELRAVPASVTVPSAAEIVESSETLQTLLRELAQLEDSLREVVTLRYMRGLDSAAISRQLRVPAGTVRWRLKRGLERLRERLDARHGGDRERWLGALSVFLGPAPKAASYALPLLIAVGVAVIGIGVWAIAPPIESPVSRSDDSAFAAASEMVDSVVATGATVDPAEADTMRSVVRESEPRAEFFETLDPGEAGVSVRVLGQKARPIQGAQLAWSRGENTFGFSSDRGVAGFAFRPPADGANLWFEIQAPGHATRRLRGNVRCGVWLDLGDVELPAARTVTGSIVDARGEACPGMRVFVTDAYEVIPAMQEIGPPIWDAFEIENENSRGDGSFRLDDVPAVPVRVWAYDASSKFVFSEVVSGRDRSSVRLVRAELDPRHRIVGRVLDPNGEPSSGAQVLYTARDGSWRLRTDSPTGRLGVANDSGSYSFPARLGVRYDLQAMHPDGAFESVVVESVTAGAVVDLQFKVR